MGLNFNATGDFKPYVAYNAKAGKLSRKIDGVDTDIALPVSFVCDFPSIRTGWFYYAAGQAPQVVLNPSLTEKVAKPDKVGADGKPLYKEGFIVDLFSAKNFGGLVEFSSSAMLVREAMNALYTAYEAGLPANAGKLPVVQLTGTKKEVGKHGTNYSPVFVIVDWVAKPTDMVASEAAAPVQEKKVANEF